MAIDLVCYKLTALLVDSAAKGTILLALVALVVGLLARHRPAWQGLLWASALTALILLPVASALLPGLQIPHLPPSPVKISSPALSTPSPPLTPPAVDGGTPALRPPTAPPLERSHAPTATPPSGPHLTWTFWVAAIYLAGLAVSLLRMGIGLWRVGRLRRKVQTFASAADIMRLNHWRVRLRVKVPVDLGLSDRISVPTVVGIRRPLILVPNRLMEEGNAQTLDGVLVHELAHVKRQDALWNLLGLLAAALYWYHPLVHLTRRWLAAARELVCDDWAVSILDDAKTYAATLLEVTTFMDRRPAVALGMDMARTTRVVERVERILAPGNRVLPRAGRFTAGISIAAILSTLVLLGSLKSEEGRRPGTEGERPPGTWTIAFKLDTPNLVPPAVQYIVMAKDPVPGFRANVSRMRSFYKDRVSKETDPAKIQHIRWSQMRVSWEWGFRDVTGDLVYLLTSSPEGRQSLASNAPAGKRWIVTKMVPLKGKPVCWNIPVEVKMGQEIEVTLSESNVFNLDPIFEDALERFYEEPETMKSGPLESGKASAPTTFENQPQARALYDGMIAAMRGARTLSYQSAYRWESEGKELDRCTYRVWMKKPNQFRVEVTTQFNILGGTLVGDGEQLWAFWPGDRPRLWPMDSDAEIYEKTSRNVYLSESAPVGRHSIGHKTNLLGSNLTPILDPSTFHGYTDSLQPHIDAVRSVGSETVGGEPCDGVEVSIMKGQRSWLLWLAKTDHLPRKLKQVVRVKRDIIAEEAWSEIKINAELPDSLFVWTPPKDWTQWFMPSLQAALLKPGTTAPEFALRSPDGKVIKLSDYRGKVVWVNFWRVGCPPCRDELPYLEKLYRKHKDKGLVVLGVNCADRKELAVDLLRKHSVSYPNIVDSSGEASDVAFNQYKGSGVPLNYVVGPDGKVADAWYGYGPGDERGAKVLAKLGMK